MLANLTKPLLRLRRHISDPQPSTPPLFASLPLRPSLLQIKQTHANAVVSGNARFILHILSLLSLSSFTPFPLEYCISIFNSIEFPTVFAFNNIIRCHAKANSPPSESIAIYSAMLRRRRFVKPNQHTFTFALHACTKRAASGLGSGVQVHAHVVKLGFARDVFVRNALIHLYCECGSSVESFKRVFEEEEDTLCSDVVTWNSVLAGVVRNGEIRDAEKVFDEMPERDVVSWSTMIMGYVQNGLLEDGLECFSVMREKGIRPNEAALVSVLSASAQLGLLECGRFVHSTIESLKFRITVPVGTALVDMYAKCGCIEKSRALFESISGKDIWTWNVMICGLASHGLAKDALALFHKFLSEGFIPVNVTFVGVLNACSMGGLVSEGKRYFNLMVDCYGIQPEMEHYGCMVDLLARAGLVDEAVHLIETMTVEPDPVLWATLLDACKVHGFVDMGEKIGNKLIQLDPMHDGHYVQLAGIYAKARKWEDVVRVRKLMIEKVSKKVAGWSLVELEGGIHHFVAGDKDHDCSSDIYRMLETIGQGITAAGYPSVHLTCVA
ncbi:pentatricopeptide repeat-containing protein At5g48910-like [Lotus japonicus]|uniref:pentatricopeptide repeat-containing protein At5g48910-like n=1 Tax=Lotus japonicus TaxID=34305 RepID=UPI0025910AB3|nr:pentatricopeptide repeat-containing protein At5g48910-like [Lotus japonicus]